MRIAVLGAGGVGGYYGAALARAGHQVELLARGEHLERIREEGLRVRTPEDAFTVSLRATDRSEELGPPDLAVVAVKAYSLPSVAPAASRLARLGAGVLPLLNGVEAAERLASLGVPREALLAGVTYISAVRPEPGLVERRSPFQRVLLGEPGGGASQRAEAAARAFREAGADARAVPDIQVELWRKLVFLASLAAVCGLGRVPVGRIRAAPGGTGILRRAVREAAAVARKAGVALPEDEEDRAMELLLGLPDDMLPSFVLDLEAGGPTELDVLSGTISRLGGELGVDTPVHDVAMAALSAAVAGGAEGP